MKNREKMHQALVVCLIIVCKCISCGKEHYLGRCKPECLSHRPGVSKCFIKFRPQQLKENGAVISKLFCCKLIATTISFGLLKFHDLYHDFSKFSMT